MDSYYPFIVNSPIYTMIAQLVSTKILSGLTVTQCSNVVYRVTDQNTLEKCLSVNCGDPVAYVLCWVIISLTLKLLGKWIHFLNILHHRNEKLRKFVPDRRKEIFFWILSLQQYPVFIIVDLTTYSQWLLKFLLKYHRLDQILLKNVSNHGRHLCSQKLSYISNFRNKDSSFDFIYIKASFKFNFY